MPNIITTTQLQKKIGQISDSIEKSPYIVTNHGEGRIIMLPYFDGCDESIAEYMEDFEMIRNKVNLQKRYSESKTSGNSNLVV